VCAEAFPALAAPAWVAAADDAGEAVKFVGQAGVVCDTERVYAIGTLGGQTRVLAYRRRDGVCLWSAGAAALEASSWSSPAVDSKNGSVVVATGMFLVAFDAASGAVRWETELRRPVVNASPLVTGDRAGSDRAFITDSDGFGGSALLYCVNVDAFDSAANPFAPGEVVWTVGIGSASGSTPAYADGVVFLAGAGDGGVGAGRVMAFDAGAAEEPVPLWTFENVKSAGFFGGVGVSGGAVYAASYAFTGGRTSANLVKLDAATGVMAWSVGCNRTDSTPVAFGDRVVVSGGIGGFGSLPTVQVFRDLGASAEMEWDSAAATWQDLDHDGVIETGEYTPMGGWTHQPVVGAAGAARQAGGITQGGGQ
jgi:outer membrane protein assembly factor BamB